MAVSKNEVRTKFLQVKDHLDQVVYSILRTENLNLADELYLRLKEEGASFPQLARLFSEGPEKDQAGIVGPCSMTDAHPLIVEKLRGMRVGELLRPFWFKQYAVLLRLEDRIPAKFSAYEDELAQSLAAVPS